MGFSFLVKCADYQNQWKLPSRGLDIFRYASCIVGEGQGTQRSLKEDKKKIIIC